MIHRAWLGLLLFLLSGMSRAEAQPGKRDYPYFEVEGTVEDYQYLRNWRSYYWREDFTLLVRDDKGKRWRIISREPTPWIGKYRFGPTYTSLKVDWKKKPRVQIIGVRAIDRSPADFYDQKLDPDSTATAFIVRVQTSKDAPWEDYFVNNWFHRWGAKTDVPMLAHFVRKEPRYYVCGYLAGIAAPLDAAGKKLLGKHGPNYNGIIYRGRIHKAKNDVGYEVQVTHLVGRNKKTARYEVFHGDPLKLALLDTRKP